MTKKPLEDNEIHIEKDTLKKNEVAALTVILARATQAQNPNLKQSTPLDHRWKKSEQYPKSLVRNFGIWTRHKK